MRPLSRRRFAQLATLAPFAAQRALADLTRLGGGEHRLRLVYTNDFHSAFDPIPGYWLPGTPRLGGAAHLATLVERQRAGAATSFLVDSGDMFTGTLSLLTKGEALLEMMIAMGYDAMGVGNHEFDYGWQSFEEQLPRAAFPILCANVRYRRGEGERPIRFCRPHAIVERNGVRLGIVSVMGARAAKYTIMPSKVEGLEFTDPVAEAAEQVARLRPAVDVVVMLAHQGLPGPMQTDAENDPSVQRPLDEDLDFCGAVSGIDVYVAAHSHHGIEEPIVHPKTGTLLVQTYGYGTRVGVLDLVVRDGRVVEHRGELSKVWSDELPAQPRVAERIAFYRTKLASEIGPVIGTASARFIAALQRRVVARLARHRRHARAVAKRCRDHQRRRSARRPPGGWTEPRPRPRCSTVRQHAGHARAFRPRPALCDRARSLPLRRLLPGLGSRRRASIRSGPLAIAWSSSAWPGRPVVAEATYRVATNSFLAEGGDRYESLKNGRKVAEDALLSDCVVDHLKRRGTIAPPPPGRLVAV